MCPKHKANCDVCVAVAVCFLTHAQLFVTPRIVAHQAPLSMKFSKQEYWSGLPFPPPDDLSNSGIKPESPESPALAGRFFITSTSWETMT